MAAATGIDRTRLRNAIAMDRDLPLGRDAFDRFRAGEEIDWAAIENAAVALLNDRVRHEQWGLVAFSCAHLAEMSHLQGHNSRALDYGLLRLCIHSAGGGTGIWRGGVIELTPGAVDRIISYIEQPDWLLIMKIMGEAVEAVAAWGGKVDHVLVRKALERELVRRFGPQAAIDHGL